MNQAGKSGSILVQNREPQSSEKRPRVTGDLGQDNMDQIQEKSAIVTKKKKRGEPESSRVRNPRDLEKDDNEVCKTTDTIDIKNQIQGSSQAQNSPQSSEILHPKTFDQGNEVDSSYSSGADLNETDSSTDPHTSESDSFCSESSGGKTIPDSTLSEWLPEEERAKFVDQIQRTPDEVEEVVQLKKESEEEKQDYDLKRFPKHCKVCLKKGVHFFEDCPYLKHVPKGARVGRGATRSCITCGKLCGKRSTHTEGEFHAVIKYCVVCGKHADHWSRKCLANNVEYKEYLRKKGNKAIPVKMFRGFPRFDLSISDE